MAPCPLCLCERIYKLKKYYNEAAYQLCDGFTINNGYYSIYPNLGGTFNGLRDSLDPKRNPLSFRFRTNKPLRKLAESIAILGRGC